MKTFRQWFAVSSQWFAVPTAMAIALGTAGAALTAPVTITPSSVPAPLSGTSGGSQKDASCAGFIATAPNHVVQITEDTQLDFSLKSSGQPALLIRGASGQNYCVPAASGADNVVIPGFWAKGTYSVFVGDRGNGRHPYTLSISRP